MARIPSVAALERRLAALKAREAALATRQKQAPKVGTGQPRPTEMMKYQGLFVPEDFTVRVQGVAVLFFGGATALGLAEPGAEPPLPRGYKPTQVKCSRGVASPTTVTSTLSKKKYLKYTTPATGNTRVSYTCPISATTPISLLTKFKAIATDKKGDIGEYGRIWLDPERPVFSLSGDAPGGP
jgi:hypothetical protein